MTQTNAVQTRSIIASRATAVLIFVIQAAGSVHAFAQEDRLGGVMGRVTLAGKIVRPRPLPVFKNRSYCGTTVVNETLLIGADGGLKNAVLTLMPLEHQVPLRPRTITLDNFACAFIPHVQVAPLGSQLVLKNSDPILHTVHARLGTETLFNVGLPHWKQVTKDLQRAGILRINCDVLHTWMSAAIVVTTTPYFAVSDVKGEFYLDNVLPGEYRLDVWHEKLGGKSARVFVRAGGTTGIDLVYAASLKS